MQKLVFLLQKTKKTRVQHKSPCKGVKTKGRNSTNKHGFEASGRTFVEAECRGRDATVPKEHNHKRIKERGGTSAADGFDRLLGWPPPESQRECHSGNEPPSCSCSHGAREQEEGDE